jgi:hypothetical protein
MIRSVPSFPLRTVLQTGLCLLVAVGACIPRPADGESDDGGSGGGDPEDGSGEGEGEPAVEPLPTEDRVWTYTEVDGAVCGNGDPVGVATNRGSSSRLVVYLEGGGACWNGFTCSNGFAVFVDTGLPQSVVRQISSLAIGIFDRGAPANPFAADSFAYVPYCTGDVHSGSRPDAPWGVQHVGSDNLAVMLPRILAAWPSVDEVVLAGTSAGGYGVIYNAERLRAALAPSTSLSLLVDSAIPLPPFPGGEVYAAEQVAAWEPTLCDGCNTVEAMFDHVVRALPGSRIGLIQSNADPTLRQFYSPSGQQLPVATWKAAVDAFVAARDTLENVRFFTTGEERHVYVYDRDLDATVVDGVTLGAWMQGVVGDGAFVSSLTP